MGSRGRAGQYSKNSGAPAHSPHSLLRGTRVTALPHLAFSLGIPCSQCWSSPQSSTVLPRRHREVKPLFYPHTRLLSPFRPWSSSLLTTSDSSHLLSDSFLSISYALRLDAISWPGKVIIPRMQGWFDVLQPILESHHVNKLRWKFHMLSSQYTKHWENLTPIPG